MFMGSWLSCYILWEPFMIFEQPKFSSRMPPPFLVPCCCFFFYKANKNVRCIIVNLHKVMWITWVLLLLTINFSRSMRSSATFKVLYPDLLYHWYMHKVCQKSKESILIQPCNHCNSYTWNFIVVMYSLAYNKLQIKIYIHDTD